MRLITWNCCRGGWETKWSRLEGLKPDIAVIQEIGKPEKENSQIVWRGENPRQGIGIWARTPFRIVALPEIDGVPHHVIPLRVEGPLDFNMLVVWAKGGKHKYVEGVVKAMEQYSSLFRSAQTVVLGDFNSNSKWDAGHLDHLSHSALVRNLSVLGATSAYHWFKGESHGEESIPTLYFQWKKERGFHIDYCFLPTTWLKYLKNVSVEGFDEWQDVSDHRPLVVDVAVPYIHLANEIGSR